MTVAIADIRDPGTDQDPVIESEQQLLGAILLRPSVLDEVALDPRRFLRPAHEVLAETLLAMHGRFGIDAVTVTDRLLKTKARVPHTLAHNLVGGCLTAANASWHWRVVTEAWVRRHVAEALTGGAIRTADRSSDPVQLVTEARSLLADLADSISGTGEPERLDTDIDDVIETLIERDQATPTGWNDLDRLLGGWRPGAVYVVAARPGNGKSLMALNAALRVATTAPVLMHSLEMTRTELQHRALSATARVGSERFHTGVDLSEAEWQRISKARGQMAEMTLVVDDRTGVSAADIHSRARSVVDRHGSLGLVVVDYIQLVQTRQGRRETNRQEEVAATSRALKVLAMDLRCPVLVCAQLNRASEQRVDGKPRVSDLRESGSLEQDADVVMLLHRDPDPDKATGELEVVVGKNRHGPTGAFSLAWRPHVSRVDPLDRRHLEAV